MNVLAKLCLYSLLPYWVATNSDVTSGENRPAKRAKTSTLTNINAILGLTTTTFTNEGLPDVKDELWLQQKLDHSNLANTGRWDQRYFINKTHYTGNGPVLLGIGGIEEINVPFIESGSWYEYARRTRALLVYVEHRYYGESRPVDDLKTDNLIYLTIEQALADLGYFIARIRKLHSNCIPSTAKWIAFGASFAGTLAVRLRMQFPHLVHAAVASSAPLLEIVNFREYYENVENEANKNYPGVMSTVKNAFTIIHKAINDGKIEHLKKEFNMCSFLNENNGQKNEKLFFWMLARFLTKAIFYGDELTDILVNDSTTDSSNRVAYVVKTLVHRNQEPCLLIDYDTAVEQYRNPLWDADQNYSLKAVLGNRANLYQRCSEFGQFYTSERKDSLFGDEIKMEFYAGFCADVFGNEYNLKLTEEGVERAKIYYGGVDIKVKRVLFVNGVLNPRYQLSVTDTEETEDRIAINIPDALATQDYLYPSMNASVQQAQIMIINKLVEWLL